MTLTDLFFDQPVFNSSYEYPVKRWELEERATDPRDHQRPEASSIHHADPAAEEAARRATKSP